MGGKCFEIGYYNFWFSSFGNTVAISIAVVVLVLLIIFFVIPPKQIQALKVLHPISSYVVVGVIGVLFIFGWLGADALGLGNQSKG